MNHFFSRLRHINITMNIAAQVNTNRHIGTATRTAMFSIIIRKKCFKGNIYITVIITSVIKKIIIVVVIMSIDKNVVILILIE